MHPIHQVLSGVSAGFKEQSHHLYHPHVLTSKTFNQLSYFSRFISESEIQPKRHHDPTARCLNRKTVSGLLQG